jgi:hypothetical protein
LRLPAVSRPGRIDRWLERGPVRLVCVAFLGVSLVLLVLSFVGAEGGLTRFGPPLGADFAGFYNAATVLNLPDPAERDRLYDVPFQDELYHRLLPALAEEKHLPFVHPPFVAVAIRPLARLPYAPAFGVWLIVSALLYAGGLLALHRTADAAALDWPTTVLLALSFEPFLMECWLGGQLSALGFLCFASAVAMERQGRPFAAGLALGLGAYKPTLLVLSLPMLVIGRRWRTLAGFAVTVSALATTSYFCAGETNCREFLRILSGFARTALGGAYPGAIAVELPLSKFVDLNAFYRLLLGDRPVARGLLFLGTALVPLVWLSGDWVRRPSLDPAGGSLLWAATVSATTVINLYVGVYDSILAASSAVLAADHFLRADPAGKPRLPPGFRGLLVALYVVPWVTQPVAKRTGLQPYTLVLLGLTAYVLIALRRTRGAATRFSTGLEAVN